MWRRASLAVIAFPFEVLITFFGLVGGITLVVGRVAPPSIDALLPPGLVAAWATVLIVGSGLTLLGLLVSEPWLERTGLAPLASAAFIYALAIIIKVGSAGRIAALIDVAYGLACLARFITLARLQSRLREQVYQAANGRRGHMVSQ